MTRWWTGTNARLLRRLLVGEVRGELRRGLKSSKEVLPTSDAAGERRRRKEEEYKEEHKEGGGGGTRKGKEEEE